MRKMRRGDAAETDQRELDAGLLCFSSGPCLFMAFVQDLEPNE